MSKSKHVGHKPKQPARSSSYPNRRNRAGRTGLDPMDTYNEFGYMQGVFLRNLLRGQLRTRNRFYQVLMGTVGVGGCLLLVGAVIDGLKSHTFDPVVFCFFIPFGILGMLLLSNLWFSLNNKQ